MKRELPRRKMLLARNYFIFKRFLKLSRAEPGLVKENRH